jgi:tetratricopeptide (TPR) repeat protein/cold shock CspA family protein
MSTDNEIIAQAENLRKQQKLIEAVPLYQQVWQSSRNSFAAHWLIYCQRKSGHIDQANQIAREALTVYPDNTYIRTELGWVIYDCELKPAREKGDIGRVLHFAREAVDISNNDLLVLKVAQIVIKTAKNLNQPRWDVIAEWAPKIKPNQLGDKKRVTEEGKEYMSEREEWYVSYSRALLEMQKYQTAREVAQQGIQEFANEIFLLRTAAWARFNSGDKKLGAQEMRGLLKHPRCDWYVKAELADMERQLGNIEEAYRLVCQALQSRQDDKYKLSSFETLARLALQMDRLDVAAYHIALSKSVRTLEDWKIPADLSILEQQVKSAYVNKQLEYPALPEDARKLSQTCIQIWKEGSSEGLLRFTGTVLCVSPERKFTFIQPEGGGENVFVFLRELPRDCAREGARVEYSLEKSFDQKKNRESFRAIQVRKA